MDSSLVYLVQTDTTVGFSSSNDEKLSVIKQRPKSKKILHTVDSFKTLQKYTRVPKKYRKQVRKSSLTTFIYPNEKSFRVIKKEDNFYDFIHKFGILYSTSANKTSKNFEKEFALSSADIIVEDKNNFFESSASKIIKLSKTSLKHIR
ncbi:Sua5 YciO YrdC YwlC family protein [Poseidonibacter ostreae]|mgnify:CR=1 FL=1|jgi:tRNA A37 threonylcarbamoyladenosine synthetase subunit TsaC/SUA5/YrdC|uniref:Sua5 YciO YrdC YwlC family protein n=1 Tax=Poseidonibacter ostreae TaxID=2654171 RepID=A0A6L4WQB2_9BACT|nr:Sua5 YciO YrdC YwlC family protein [Poseidonibacter ostreae]KAB7885320.1 Sua5 YciO YrdC YwlC family protein [Poseidonibacter ostreae]KAB7886586.1 Sua5 YciO YrdC YwlC family protein [Poseidonibacter ostreae]KAB7889420.1 Sua5 YciO YrdC YwlC family protein [Poseidonibacter ostreae]MAC84071.1 Sua5 YciO YrdC YwlC family protein [Arcobacter sp.]|tara:strand:+ start:951 stop:1394 length:444 start_codon:yes stop_codon:yes gene_type:complete